MRHIPVAVVAIATASGGAAAQTPTALAVRPSGPWSVEYADQMCVMSRPYRSGTDEIFFGIRTGISEDTVTLFVAQPAGSTGAKSRHGNVTIAADGLPPQDKQPYDSRVAPKSNLRFFTTSATLPVVDAIEKAGRVSLAIDGAETTHFAVPGLAKARAALRLCDEDLMKGWGIDMAARALIAKPAEFAGKVGSFFRADMYPAAARRAGQQGRVVALMTVDAEGAVQGCKVIVSAKSPSLDKVTCEIVTRRVRMKPARDAAGTAIPSQKWLSVNWSLEG